MDWQKCMNQAMEYIEENLTDVIEYGRIAKIVGCSECEFRRMFSFLTQMPLSEYIRRRRLTVSINDIQNGDKIIDVSNRYGYESQAAFSRAFRQLHGVSPSLARDKNSVLKSFPQIIFKLVLKEDVDLKTESGQKRHVIGGNGMGYAIAVELVKEKIHKTNEEFWDTIGNESIGALSLPNYGAFITEGRCQFLKDIKGKKVLEIGCGTGRSLKYVGDLQASELWGLDISSEQIGKADKLLRENHMDANLVCSPMEDECGIPNNHFDYVYSVYGIGWSTDLDNTFKRVASYLKTDGLFIFSWSHPIHKCVAPEEDGFSFKKSYFDESWYSVSLDGGHISLSDRKMSTYINALAKAGFLIEELIEESEEEITSKRSGSFSNKAKLLPVTFVIKARKISDHI